MAAITAYLDDSGTSPDNPVACAAGFLSPVPQWKKFERDWRDARYIPGDEFICMHIAECVANNRKSEFHDWDLPKKRRVLQRLRSIIKNRAVQSVGMAVSKRYYDTLVNEEVRRKTGNHFTFSVLLTMSQAGGWRRDQNIPDPIEYVFDWMDVKDPRRKELEELLENECERGTALSDYGLISGGYSFRHKEDVVPLQAADMLAWTLYNGIQLALDIKPITQLAGEGYSDFQNHRKANGWFKCGYLTDKQMEEFATKLPHSPIFTNDVKELSPQKKRK